MGPSQQAVHDAVWEDQETLISWLRDLVRFDTSNPPGREREAQVWMAQQLAELGLSVDHWDVLPGRPNTVGVWKGTGGGRSAILNGHVDVAEVGRPELWTRPPFGGIVEGRRLYGRGSGDMKAGLAAFYFAMKGLRGLGFRPRGDVIFESVMGEEQSEPGARACLERGYRADFAVVGENTEAKRIVPNVGVINGCVTISAPYTRHVAHRVRYLHAGGQMEGANALEKMALKIIPALNDLERDWANRYVHPLFPAGQQIINPFFMEGGGNTFVTPDSCKLYFTVYYLPTRKKEDVLRDVAEHIQKAAEADIWLRAHPPTVEWKPSRFPIETVPSDIDPDDPGTRCLIGAHEKVWKEPPLVGGYGFAADVGWLYQAGIPAFSYGPGSHKLAHNVDEHVEIDEVLRCTEVIALFLCEWTG